MLYPLGENSPINNFLKSNKNGGIHHICIEVFKIIGKIKTNKTKNFFDKVDNIREAIKTVKANKIRCLNEEPKIGAHGKPVVFLHPKDCCGTLVELEQV